MLDPVRVIGLREFRSALRGVDRAWPRALTIVHKAIGDFVALRAEERAPRLKTRPGTTSMRPGQLADSIRGVGNQSRAAIRAGGARLPHPSIPMIHEFGWPGHGIEPQPFMFPAEEESREEVVELYAEMIDDVTRTAFPS